jgi:hypothetical protein
MDSTKEQLAALQDIRKMMQDSSKFLSLSGFSGIFAGIFAILGALLGSKQIENYFLGKPLFIQLASAEDSLTITILLICSLVLFLSLSFAYYFSKKKAEKNGVKLFDTSSRKLLFNIAIPLFCGGIFSLAMLYHGGNFLYLIGPAMLIFYGLALLNGGKYTLHEIKVLGILEIILGTISLFTLGYGLLFWTIGFGVLHIIYGALIWYKHDRN